MSLLTSADLDRLREDGFTVVRGFLTESELSSFVEQREAGAQHVVGIGIMPRDLVTAHEPRMQEVARSVHDAGIHVDRVDGGLWFSTARGVNFNWHQDTDSYYTTQDHHHYINVYIPVIKPELTKTNLKVVPFSALRANIPDEAYRELLGRGAKMFRPAGDSTVVINAERGGKRNLPIDIDKIAVAPELAAGDAMILRGDVIHRTQDSETMRVSASFRLINSQGVVRKAQLCSGGFHKWNLMLATPQQYETMLRAFATHKVDELPMGKLLDHLHAERNSIVSFPLLQRAFVERLTLFLSQLGSLDQEQVRAVMCACERCTPMHAWITPMLGQLDRLSAKLPA